MKKFAFKIDPNKVFSVEGLEHIASGSFSKCCLQENGRVLLWTQDIPKHAMSDSQFPEHRLFPEVNHVGEEDGKELYDMPRYNQKNLYQRLHPRQKRLYDEIREISWECQHDTPSTTIDAINSMPSELYREKKAMIEAFNFIRKFTDEDKLGFEHAPQNLAEKNGKLILLDSFYTWESPKIGE